MKRYEGTFNRCNRESAKINKKIIYIIPLNRDPTIEKVKYRFASTLFKLDLALIANKLPPCPYNAYIIAEIKKNGETTFNAGNCELPIRDPTIITSNTVPNLSETSKIRFGARTSKYFFLKKSNPLLIIFIPFIIIYTLSFREQYLNPFSFKFIFINLFNPIYNFIYNILFFLQIQIIFKIKLFYFYLLNPIYMHLLGITIINFLNLEHIISDKYIGHG